MMAISKALLIFVPFSTKRAQKSAAMANAVIIISVSRVADKVCLVL